MRIGLIGVGNISETHAQAALRFRATMSLRSTGIAAVLTRSSPSGKSHDDR